ncbi:cation channel sperm-associated protein 3 [Falco peregrinus]|uniref:cation channel sperm-associated protein 3 n=1 Tax=Falco peregrinus TaxID=8954 RepID=UPI002478CDE0|nr:cation channel sperm-associated protein 3 [Falco peregrinus]
MFEMVPLGRGMLLGTFNRNMLAGCVGSGSHRQQPGLTSSSLQITDAFFVAAYTIEPLLKLYVDPIAYWKSSCTTLDATTLLNTFLPHVLPVDVATCTQLEGTTKGLQTLRILKLIKQSRGVRVKHRALVKSQQRGGIPSPGTGGGFALPRCRGLPSPKGADACGVLQPSEQAGTSAAGGGWEEPLALAPHPSLQAVPPEQLSQMRSRAPARDAVDSQRWWMDSPRMGAPNETQLAPAGTVVLGEQPPMLPPLCKVFTEALGQPVQTVMYAPIMLYLLMFAFAILGHGWYGDPKTGDSENWGSWRTALFTLFSLLTVDGWSDLQREMDCYGLMSSHVFMVVFILLGNFTFFSMSVALAITKTQVTQALCIECSCMCESV